MEELFLIDDELWRKSRAGARSGRGFRYQDAVAAQLAIKAWRGDWAWTTVVPEGVDDLTLHGPALELRVQLKSRHDPRGRFTVDEVVTHLAKTAKSLPQTWSQDSRLGIALVLERAVDGLTATGWGKTLADSGQALDALRNGLRAELSGWPIDQVEALLGRAYLIVEAKPMDEAVARLVAGTPYPDAAARLLAQRFRELAGAMADANYLAPSTRPGTLGVSDVQQVVDAFGLAFDPAAFLDLSGGLCEAADFFEPVDTSGFYSGVDVAPAHIGAGVVFDRPVEVTAILEGLEQHRAALVAGPSGAGKSGLAWLSAFHTRHAVRWYRVRLCRTDDVARLVAWARLLEANPERPVGFVVDDVGRGEETSGWDLLIREKNAVPGLLLIGTAREEDLFTLRSLPQTSVFRPKLDEALAIRVWEALSGEGASVFKFWREPLEVSRGLLLEYAHLLTAGRRLEETLTEQVARRLAEGRDDELIALRAIAFATAQGAAIDPGRLRSRLGWETPRFARAIKRLVDEHTIRERGDASLSALHEIRSTYLDAAIQNALGEPRRTALVEAVYTVEAGSFASLVVRTLRKWPDEKSSLLEAAGQRLSDPDTPAGAWIAVLYGLAVATADMVAERWLEIARANDIDDRFAGLAFNFVVAKSNFDGVPLFARVKNAQADFAKVKVGDLRTALFERLAPGSRPPIVNLASAHELIAAMLPLAGCEAGPKLEFGCEDNVGEADLMPLLEFLQVLAEVDAEQAVKIVDICGGAEVLLERLYLETAWITRPSLGEQDGEAIVTAKVRAVSAPSQSNLEESVARVCELMAMAAPAAQLMICEAVFANDSPFGVGMYTVRRTLRRDVMPSPARIALNRVVNRSIGRLVATDSETDRATMLARAMADLSRLLGDAANYYCRQEQPGPYWSGLKIVRGLMTQVIPPPQQAETFAGPLDQGTYKAHDSLHGFATNIQELIGELTQVEPPKVRLMALRARDLAKEAGKLTDPDFWRMTGERPTPALETIRTILLDLAAVLSDVDADPLRLRAASLRFSKVSRHNNILARAAKEARERTAADVGRRCVAIAEHLAAHGLSVEVYARIDGEDVGLNHLNARYIALQRVDEIVDWFKSQPLLIAACETLPDDLTTLASAPLRDGVIAPIAVQFGLSLLPYGGLVSEWQAKLPYPVLEDRVLDDYRAAVEALVTASFILQETGRPLLAEEDAHLDTQVETVAAVSERAAAAVDSDPSADLAEILGFLGELGVRVGAEQDGTAEGTTVAVEMLNLESELAQTNLGAQILLMERGVSRHQSQQERVARN
ncbi:hypothetical protein [Caulobacter sp. FWC2]|uniref:hypothetical protein n=1 Tax=Caulobacter sp. FWC2 TaxID=69664 RepID=UPI001177DC1D|nr:hypothetical protein [Caulobacter sp. FWC2]